MVVPVLNGAEVVSEEVGQEEGEVEDEFLVGVARGLVGLSDIWNDMDKLVSSTPTGAIVTRLVFTCRRRDLGNSC